VTELRGAEKKKKLYKMMGTGTDLYADAIHACTQCRIHGEGKVKIKGQKAVSLLDCLDLARGEEAKKDPLRAINNVCAGQEKK
jgi:hypothetical protein